MSQGRSYPRFLALMTNKAVMPLPEWHITGFTFSSPLSCLFSQP